MFADRFIAYNLTQNYESLSYARRFLASQLEDTRDKLTRSKDDLNQYARAAGIIGSNDGNSDTQTVVLPVTNNQLIQFNTVVAAATAERIAAESRWKTFIDKPALWITEVNSNRGVTQVIGAKARAEAELADEISRHSESYSTVKAKRAQIAELDRRLATMSGAIKNSAQVDYLAAVQKEKSLIEQVGVLRGEAFNEQDRTVQYSVLKRIS